MPLNFQLFPANPPLRGRYHLSVPGEALKKHIEDYVDIKTAPADTASSISFLYLFRVDSGGRGKQLLATGGKELFNIPRLLMERWGE